MRKSAFVFPTVIQAAAGPHDLGPGGRDDIMPPKVEARSVPDSDIAYCPRDEGWGDGGHSATSVDSESDIVIHNTTFDECDNFDIIADYIFQNSNAESVLVHHRDIALLRELGSSTDIPALLSEVRPPIAVDENGVGTVGGQRGTGSGGLQSSPMSDGPTSAPPGNGIGDTAEATSTQVSEDRSLLGTDKNRVGTLSPPSPSTHYRVDLNNLLQGNGGAGRLRWGDPIGEGPANCPSWTIQAYLDGMEYGRGTGETVDLAKEDAAGQVLRHLLAPSF